MLEDFRLNLVLRALPLEYIDPLLDVLTHLLPTLTSFSCPMAPTHLLAALFDPPLPNILRSLTLYCASYASLDVLAGRNLDSVNLDWDGQSHTAVEDSDSTSSS